IPRLGAVLVEGGPAMVIVMNHLRLVQGHPNPAIRVHPNSALLMRSCGAQLSCGAEKPTVICHVKHAHELDAPGVPVYALSLINQHRDPVVSLEREFRVGPGTEDRTSPGIGVD